MKTDADREANANGWVRRIAANVLRDHYRGVLRRREVQPSDGVVDPPSAVVGPADLAAQRDTWEVVRDAIHRLPDAHREMLVRHFLDGQSHEQIAQALGLKLKASHQRLHRAVERLRTELGLADEEDRHAN